MDLRIISFVIMKEVYDNPSPGNREGGITTLEDKSCGCVQKGGTAPIMDVIGYGDPVVTKGRKDRSWSGK